MNVISRYNRIMNKVGYEHKVIGREETKDWNVADMVNECAYILSTYKEIGHANEELKYEDYKTWKSETGMLERFIKQYEDTDDIPVGSHCALTDIIVVYSVHCPLRKEA